LFIYEKTTLAGKKKLSLCQRNTLQLLWNIKHAHNKLLLMYKILDLQAVCLSKRKSMSEWR
jgi:hypothetical protein